MIGGSRRAKKIIREREREESVGGTELYGSCLKLHAELLNLPRVITFILS